MEFPNLPYLFDEDVKLTETLAIMKYVAKKWKPELLGRNAAEVGRVNMLEYYVY
jgi:glutathione S-transferase